MRDVDDCEQAAVMLPVELRDWFAAHAPAEIPRWFTRDESPLPALLPAHRALEQQEGFSELPESEKTYLCEWLRDGTWDLDDPLKSIGEKARAALEANSEARGHAKEQREIDRYFAWRWMYADAMLRVRSKS